MKDDKAVKLKCGALTALSGSTSVLVMLHKVTLQCKLQRRQPACKMDVDRGNGHAWAVPDDREMKRLAIHWKWNTLFKRRWNWRAWFRKRENNICVMPLTKTGASVLPGFEMCDRCYLSCNPLSSFLPLPHFLFLFFLFFFFCSFFLLLWGAGVGRGVFFGPLFLYLSFICFCYQQ